MSTSTFTAADGNTYTRDQITLWCSWANSAMLECGHYAMCGLSAGDDYALLKAGKEPKYLLWEDSEIFGLIGPPK